MRAFKESSKNDSAKCQQVLTLVDKCVRQGDLPGIVAATTSAASDFRKTYKVFQKLTVMLNKEPHEVATAATLGLTSMVGLGQFALADALKSDNENVRFLGAFGLEKMGHSVTHVVAQLRAVANDPNEMVRHAVAEAIQSVSAPAKPGWKFW